MTDGGRVDGTRVAIAIAEPWELVEALRESVVRGRVVRTGPSPWDARERAVLVELDPSAPDEALPCGHVVAQARYVGESVLDLVGGEPVTCTFSGIADEDVAADRAFDESAQGEPRFRGTLSAAGHEHDADARDPNR